MSQSLFFVKLHNKTKRKKKYKLVIVDKELSYVKNLSINLKKKKSLLRQFKNPYT